MKKLKKMRGWAIKRSKMTRDGKVKEVKIGSQYVGGGG